MPVDKKRSIRQYETNCTGIITKAEKFAGDNIGGLTDVGKKRAENYLKELQEAFERMDKRWEDKFRPELEDTDEKLLIELEEKVSGVRDKVDKTVETLFNLLEKPSLGLASAGPPSSKSAPRMVTNFKPDILPSSAYLNEFNSWEKAFLAYMDANREFLAASNNQTKRIFVTTLLDSKVQAALEADETMRLDTIPIKSDNDELSLLKWLRTYVLRHSPLYIRRYQYSLVKQQPKETFEDFWTRKVNKGHECELQNIDAEAVQITELITGISDEKLREECLKLKDPKLADIVELGLQSDLANAVKKENFGGDDVACAYKTSEYQLSKNRNWKAKENPKSERDDGGDSGNNSGKDCKFCGYWYCPKKPCKFAEKFCSICGEKGHSSRVCSKRNEKPNEANASSKVAHASRVSVKEPTKYGHGSFLDALIANGVVESDDEAK